MWFSWVIGPLGPSIRKHYTAIYDLESLISRKIMDNANKLVFFRSEILDLSRIEDLVYMAKIDPDSIDRFKTSNLKNAIMLVYR
ncbi:MAG: hypothetical protein DRO15_07715 [Thermoprotei archaeon]|nr:MAG: hypothetical protein DRO15_07715 [Thermoprotei archaeon]